jgi:uncharacterized membrane protein
MNHKLALSSALAAALTLGVVAESSAGSKVKKEKCYGVTLAGQNDCGNLAGTHSCAGQSTLDNDIGEWRLVNKGSCADLGGYSKKEAKKIFKKQ